MSPMLSLGNAAEGAGGKAQEPAQQPPGRRGAGALQFHMILKPEALPSTQALDKMQVQGHRPDVGVYDAKLDSSIFNPGA